jgi:hypothetical protein
LKIWAFIRQTIEVMHFVCKVMNVFHYENVRGIISFSGVRCSLSDI